jgi:hypothetical protein
MPEQEDSTQPAAVPPVDPESPDDPPAAVPPIIPPGEWEDYQGFRESTLLWFTDAETNAALRTMGRMLYDLVLEWKHWPKHPEGIVRAELRAAIADLRCVQGFLEAIGQEREATALDPFDAHLSRLAAAVAPELGQLGDRLEKELGTWRGDTGEDEP